MIASLVDELEDGPTRAVYMAVRELHDLQTRLKNSITQKEENSNDFRIKKQKGSGK